MLPSLETLQFILKCMAYVAGVGLPGLYIVMFLFLAYKIFMLGDKPPPWEYALGEEIEYAYIEAPPPQPLPVVPPRPILRRRSNDNDMQEELTHGYLPVLPDGNEYLEVLGDVDVEAGLLRGHKQQQQHVTISRTSAMREFQTYVESETPNRDFIAMTVVNPPPRRSHRQWGNNQPRERFV